MGTEALLVAVLGSSVLTAGVGAWFARRKTKADTGDVIVQSAERVVVLQDKLVANQGKQIAELKTALAEEQRRTSDLELKVDRMEAQIAQLLAYIDAHGLEVPAVDV